MLQLSPNLILLGWARDWSSTYEESICINIKIRAPIELGIGSIPIRLSSNRGVLSLGQDQDLPPLPMGGRAGLGLDLDLNLLIGAQSSFNRIVVGPTSNTIEAWLCPNQRELNFGYWPKSSLPPKEGRFGSRSEPPWLSFNQVPIQSGFNCTIWKSYVSLTSEIKAQHNRYWSSEMYLDNPPEKQRKIWRIQYSSKRK